MIQFDKDTFIAPAAIVAIKQFEGKVFVHVNAPGACFEVKCALAAAVAKYRRELRGTVTDKAE